MTRWGILLPTFDPLRTGEAPVMAAAAARAEDAGFDSVWVGDHLLCPAPVLEATMCLAAAAAVTERVSLGFSVMLLGLRPVVWAAKQIATLQVLSGGRVKVGVGVGGEFPQEFAAAGVPVRARGRRLDEALSALPRLLGADRVGTAAGGSVGALPALEPAAPMPPLLVGGRSDAALRRAARLGDAWLPMWLSAGAVARSAERLGELARGFGRPRPALAILIGVHVDDDDTAAEAQVDQYLRGQYGLPLARVRRWTSVGAVAAVAEYLDGYRAVGVEELILMPLARRPLEQIERLATVVDYLR